MSTILCIILGLVILQMDLQQTEAKSLGKNLTKDKKWSNNSKMCVCEGTNTMTLTPKVSWCFCQKKTADFDIV